MQVRTPAVAGTFYAGAKIELEKSIRECFLHKLGVGQLPPSSSKKKIYGVICPHAGYVYSGPAFSKITHAQFLVPPLLVSTSTIVLEKLKKNNGSRKF